MVSLKYSWFIVATAGLEKRRDGAILVQSPLMKFVMATKKITYLIGYCKSFTTWFCGL